MDLSVVIVSYNTRDLLAACLASLAGSEPEIEIIVVDNASEDGSAAMVRERFPQVRLIQNLHNSGYACASNQGIRASSGRHVLLLNSDTEIRPGALARVLTFADSGPDIGTVGLQLLNPDGTLQPSGRRFPTFASALGELLPLPERWAGARVVIWKGATIARSARLIKSRVRQCVYAARRSTRSAFSTKSFSSWARTSTSAGD